MPLITDFNLDVSHIEVAIDQIHTQMLTITDLNKQQILQSAELERDSVASRSKQNAPYALTRIVDTTPNSDENEFVRWKVIAELETKLIFSAPIDSDVQRLGHRLADTIWKGLQPTDDINPGGFDIPLNSDGGKFWGFETDTQFKAKIRRTVTKIDEQSDQLTGSRYSIPLQYKIEVYPMMSHD